MPKITEMSLKPKPHKSPLRHEMYKLRREVGMSQKDLGEMLGVTQTTISMIERGTLHAYANQLVEVGLRILRDKAGIPQPIAVVTKAIKLQVPITNLYSGEDGRVHIYRRPDGMFNLEAQMGNYRSGMETNRESIQRLREALDSLLREGSSNVPVGELFYVLLEGGPYSNSVLSVTKLSEDNPTNLRLGATIRLDLPEGFYHIKTPYRSGKHDDPITYSWEFGEVNPEWQTI